MALAALPPLMTALAAALGLWIAERRKDRDEVQRRLKAIGEETARLGYLRSWLKTQQLAGAGTGLDFDAVREGVRQELLQSRTRLERALEVRMDPELPSPLLRAWRNAALMPLYRPAARAIRWCYWFCLFLGALMMMLAFSADYSEIDGYSIGMVIFVALLFFLPFGAAALGLRAWAQALERRAPFSRRPEPAASPMAREQGTARDSRTGGWAGTPSPPAAA